MLESMFNQETVTRNEILRHQRETQALNAASMLKDGVPDEKVLAWSGLSQKELDELKNKLAKEKQNQPS